MYLNYQIFLKLISFSHKIIVSKVEIEALINIYKGITKNIDRMDRLKFRDVLHNSFDMTDDILMDRGIINSFYTLLSYNYKKSISIK